MENEQTLAIILENLNEKIEEVIKEEKEIKQKISVIMRKLDRILEYNEIDDMRNTIFNNQLSLLQKRMAKLENNRNN
jgi:uncharacterized protein (UPF0335 family)